MTNGEKIQTILDIDKDCTEVYGKNGMMTFSVPQDWWNAEYKEPTTKNNLAVDCIDRTELLKAIDTWDKFGCDADTKLVTYQDHYIPYIHYDDVIKCIKGMPSVTPQPCEDAVSRQAVLDLINADWKYEGLEIEINNIPSVTPQEPKTGHWIKYDKEYFTAEKLAPVIHSIRECSECHTRIADFCGEMKFCPNCGSRNEVKE